MVGSQQDLDPRTPLSQFFESDPPYSTRLAASRPRPLNWLRVLCGLPSLLAGLATTSPLLSQTPWPLLSSRTFHIPPSWSLKHPTRDLASGPTRLLVVNGGTEWVNSPRGHQRVIRGSWEVVGHLLGAEPVPSTCEQQPWAVTVTSLPAEKTALASPESDTGVFSDSLDDGRVGRLWGQEKPRGPCSEIEDLTGRPQSIQPRGALQAAPRDCMGFMP